MTNADAVGAAKPGVAGDPAKNLQLLVLYLTGATRK